MNRERRPKLYRSGTHRTVSPQETLTRMRPLMPVLGVTRIADVTGLDCIGVPVALAVRPNARSIAVSAGKGLDLVAAKVSALMEAIEGWHAEHILAPLLLASHREIRFGRRLVNLQRLPQRTGGELHEHVRMLWIEGRDLLGEAATWVPFEVVHTNYTVPLPPCSGAFVASSNGLASGNDELEATSHAICEIVERDASTLWAASGRAARSETSVDLSTIDDSDCCLVLDRLARASVAVGVWEITSDVGIPAFRCAIVDSEVSPFRPHLPGVGTGCHPTREIALLRALTEAVQVRLTLIAGARDDIGLSRYLRFASAEAHERTLIEINTASGRRSFRAAPTFSSETFDEDVELELRCLEGVGIDQVVSVNLIQPALAVPVVRVVIPGLEGLHEAPGYLGGVRYQRRRAESLN
jgi:YcaO-like protein with predicted kinase domain